MISSEPLIRRWRSSESTEGTIRSLSPLAISVGWVIFDRSAGCRSAPPLDRLQLGPERLHRDRLVAIRGALLETFDERLGGALAGRVAVEEQELLRVLTGSGWRAACRSRWCRRPCRCPSRRPGPVPVRMSLRTSSGCLTTSAWATMPPRENEKMSTVSKPSALMKVTASSAIASTRVGHVAGGGADTAVVEGDDVMVPGDRVDDARIPVVQVGGQVDEEDHRHPALRPELAVGEGRHRPP